MNIKYLLIIYSFAFSVAYIPGISDAGRVLRWFVIGFATLIVLMIDKLDPTSIHEIQIGERDQKSGIGFIIR